MAPPTKAQYIAQLRTMFASAGWRKHLQPRLQAMRNEHMEHLAYGITPGPRDPHDIEGCRYAIRLLDDLINLEAGVKALEDEVRTNPTIGHEPASGSADEDVVESQR